MCLHRSEKKVWLAYIEWGCYSRSAKCVGSCASSLSLRCMLCQAVLCCDVHCALCTVCCLVCAVHFVLYTLLCAVCCVPCSVWCVPCAVWCVLCAPATVLRSRRNSAIAVSRLGRAVRSQNPQPMKMATQLCWHILIISDYSQSHYIKISSKLSLFSIQTGRLRLKVKLMLNLGHIAAFSFNWTKALWLKKQ